MVYNSDAFARQFVPTTGGYLYYPSRRTGAKLVTAEEYDRLVANWEKAAGRTGWWKLTALIFLILAVGVIISVAFALPDWTVWISVMACVALGFAWILPASLAPLQLVKDRPAITAPRDNAEARRQARAALTWPFVILILLASGAIFAGSIQSPRTMLSSWVWLIGSGLLFSVYVWIAVRKLRDK